MTKLNNEMRELTMNELDVVSGADKGVMGWLKEIVNSAITEITTPAETYWTPHDVSRPR